MSDFPVLKTSAVLQYPAQKETRFSTEVIRFVDGSEQRFRNYAQLLRRWIVRLDSLDEAEIIALRNFFRTQRGAAGTFRFTDPWDGTEFTNCTLDSDEMLEEFIRQSQARTTLVIKESLS